MSFHVCLVDSCVLREACISVGRTGLCMVAIVLHHTGGLFR